MTYENISTRTGVYGIYNRQNGKWYVGSAARGFSYRWGRHRSDLRLRKHSNAHLQSAFNLYGEPNFRFVILEDCPPDVCVQREQHWMDRIHPDYNIELNAASSTGCTRSEEAKKKTSLTMVGRVFSDEHKAHLREAWKHRTLTEAELNHLRTVNIGRHHTIAEKKGISSSLLGNKNSLGIHPSEETRKKLSMAGLGRTHSLETKAKMSEARRLYWAHKKGLDKLE